MPYNIDIYLLPLLLGWFADKLLGDPHWLPHPIVFMGKLIRSGEKLLNKGNNRKIKGAILVIILISITFISSFFLIKAFYSYADWAGIIVSSVLIFFSLAGKTLISEVRDVFTACDESLEKGREQVARIVGRDTSRLSGQEIRKAALETLSENLSDGVIAPLFWFIILGVPGMVTYKMINTIDSMIGYKNERYKDFGFAGAKIDDIANFIPARLTALLILISGGFTKKGFSFIKKNGSNHSSPNSGYPEAALAYILNCRFGGPNYYFGQLVEKPYIGTSDKILTTDDMKKGIYINEQAEIYMILFTVLITILL